MTNAEKQEIIEAVLAALATNSKTIAQLSPKQSLIDSDLFEVAGGSRITYQTLRSLIREGLALESRLSDYVTGEQAMMYLAKLDTETGTVDYKESPLVMLDGFNGVNGYTPVTGDLYYENYNGFQIWIKKAGGDNKEGIVANPYVAYVNKNDGAIYRWTGSSMVRIGGSAVINDLVTGGEADALSAEQGKRLKEMIDNIGTGSIAAFAQYAVFESVSALPATGVATTGYIVGNHIYAYVGTGGDTRDGKYQDLGALEAAGVSLTTNGDGTFTVHAGGNDYTVNLNHTHPNMCKLVVCEESGLPSTYDDDTIYAVTDNGEIGKLVIRGMEFAGGGGTPSTEPKIVSPIGTQIDFNGESTKTVTVRASNLSEALTVAVTGVTANLQTISVSDAANGVQLTLTKDQNFATGTLRIYSSEVDKSWGVIDSQSYQPLTAVKLTGTQWLKTPYKPKSTTTVTMICRFEENEHTIVNDQTNHGYYFMGCEQNSSSERFLFYAFKPSATQYQLIGIVPATPIKEIQSVTGFLTDRSEFKASPELMSFTPNGGTAQTVALGATPTMLKELEIGRGITNAFGVQIFNYYDLTIYELTIIEGSTTVHHYLPKSLEGVPGLYDTVTNTFISSETSDELVAIPLT